MSRSISKGQQRTDAALNVKGGAAIADEFVDAGAATLSKNQYYTATELLPYISEEERAALHSDVINTINAELLVTSDLEVSVPRLLRSCITESKELRRAMNSIASSQIVEAQRALQVVESNYKRVQELRELFLKQGELIQGLGTDTLSYKHLKQLHFLRENVSAVIKWSEALKEVRFENLYVLIEDRQFGAMYRRLRRLQKIRRTVITKAGSRYRSFQTVFEPYFSKLDVILAMYVAEVFKMLQEDSMVVALQRALDDVPESGTFERWAPKKDRDVDVPVTDPYDMLKECLHVCGEEISDPCFNFGSDGVETQPMITESAVYDAVAKSVGKVWEEQIMIDVVDPIGQISVYLEQMKKVEPLLEALQLALIPLSSKFSFFSIVVRAVHEEVIQVMDVYVDPDSEVEANGLIEASLFIQWYKEMMTTGNYTQYVDVSTIDELSASFMAAAVGGLSQHLTTLCRSCALTVCNDPKGPTILATGYPITTGPGDMFSVLQQSLAGLSASIDVTVLRKIGRACADAIYAYLDECRQRSDFDFWEDENSALPTPVPAADWQQRRLLFLYAFINDCNIIETNLDTIELRFASCWDYDFEEDDAENGGGAGGGQYQGTPFQKVEDAIPDNVFYYLDEITGQVERLVAEPWSLCFRLGDWYSDANNPLQLVLNTISEYIEEEFATMLQEQRLRKLTRQLLIRYVEKYIAMLVEFLADVIRSPKKNSVEDWNTFIDCLARDIELSFAMWRDHIADDRGRILDLSQRAMEVMKELLSVRKTVDFTYVVQDKMLDDFGDCPTFVVRFCFEARSKDIDKETRDRLMEVWMERVAFQQRDKNDVPTVGWSSAPSYFGTIDRSLAVLEKSSGFFSKSVKKKRAEEQQRKVIEEKETKRAARRARREADVAASKKTRLPRNPPGTSKGNVEVAALSDILK